MRSKHILWIIAGLSVLGSCRQEEMSGDPMPVEFRSGTSDLRLDMEYLALDVPDDLVLGNIDLIDDDGTYLYLLQVQSAGAGVYVFDLGTGSYVTRIGNRGRGPGEYVTPMSFTLMDGKICIIDGASQKALYYDTGDSFRYVGDKPVGDVSSFERYDSNCLISGNNAYYGNSGYRDKGFLLLDSNFTVLKWMVDKMVVSGYMTGLLKPIYMYGDRVRTYMQFDPVIYEYDGSDMVPVYELSFEGYRFPPSDYLKKISRGGRDYTRALRESGHISYYDFFETEDAMMSLFMSGGKRHLGIYSKRTGKSRILTESGLEEISPYKPLFISGTVDERFAIVLPVSELKAMDNLSRELLPIVRNASETDIVLQLIKTP